MSEDKLRVAPRGFTDAQWREFQEQGLIRIDNALSRDEIHHYLSAVDRVAAADPNYRPGQSLRKENAVELDPAIAELIDHDRHVGYVYDVFGEMLKLLRSDLRIRAAAPSATPGTRTARARCRTRCSRPSCRCA